MNSETTKITIEDTTLAVEYDCFPGCPQTFDDPGEPEFVNIHGITTDEDIGILFAEGVTMERIEELVLDKIKREAALDEGEARYEQREADREADREAV